MVRKFEIGCHIITSPASTKENVAHKNKFMVAQIFILAIKILSARQQYYKASFV